MSLLTDFDCHDFFDNNTICILEISVIDPISSQRQFEWLLIRKADLSVSKMELKTRDSSNALQERYFDMGFLKYDAETGVFIETTAKDLHPLEHKGCEDIPYDYLHAVGNYLQSKQSHYPLESQK